jgi:hypothetical protein
VEQHIQKQKALITVHCPAYYSARDAFSAVTGCLRIGRISLAEIIGIGVDNDRAAPEILDPGINHPRIASLLSVQFHISKIASMSLPF